MEVIQIHNSIITIDYKTQEANMKEFTSGRLHEVACIRWDVKEKQMYGQKVGHFIRFISQVSQTLQYQ